MDEENVAKFVFIRCERLSYISTTWFISIYWNHFPNKSVIYTKNKLISLLTRFLGCLCLLLISTTPRICNFKLEHDDVIKWNHFPCYWHKSQWRWALMFSLIYAWIKDWVNNREAGDLRRHRGHCNGELRPGLFWKWKSKVVSLSHVYLYKALLNRLFVWSNAEVTY